MDRLVAARQPRYACARKSSKACHGAPLTSSAMEASSAAWWRRASSRKSEIMALAAWFGMREPCGSTAPVLGDLCENQNFTARSR